MAPEPCSDDEGVLIHQLTVKVIIDNNGHEALTVAYSPEMQMTTVLGMLEYAKVTMVQLYEHNHRDPGDE